ncbi:MAG: GTPase domain-containing protein [Oleiphilaceae bacterium]|nr:GTPase domain-containing protein [Oleiphilaceae bacterium]
MAEYDAQRNQLQLKLVYYGPAQSGKTTNLASLHERLSGVSKGDMMVLETRNDRTLFFDLFPLGFEAPSGLRVKLKLYTVPGQVQHDSTRKAVLSRADAVAFIADSQCSQSENNLEAFANLADNAARVGLDFERLPLVIQFNKRDLKDIVSRRELVERWRPSPWWPLTLAEATAHKGVMESFRLLLKRAYPALDEEFALSRDHGLPESLFVDRASGQGEGTP